MDPNSQMSTEGFEDDHFKIPHLEANLESTAKTLAALNLRVSNLEANTHVTAQTLEDTQSCASNLKARIHSATRTVEEIYSQVTVVFAELQRNSQALNEIENKMSLMGCAFTLTGMRLKKSESSPRLSDIDYLEDVSLASEHTTGLIHDDLDELDRDMELERRLLDKELQERVPLPGQIHSSKQIPGPMPLCSKTTKDHESACLQQNISIIQPQLEHSSVASHLKIEGPGKVRVVSSVAQPPHVQDHTFVKNIGREAERDTDDMVDHAAHNHKDQGRTRSPQSKPISSPKQLERQRSLGSIPEE